MAFDGGFTSKVVNELQSAVDCHIEKIYQPSRDGLVFLLRKKGFNARLLLSARPGAARIHFTDVKYENPASAPLFCMLARKHFSGARITAVTQIGLDRIVEINVETTDEMGDRVTPRIVCELIGNQANVVLVAANGRIIDALRRSDIETNARIVLPGAVYTAPPGQEKSDPRSTDAALLADAVLHEEGLPLSRAVLNTVDGFSPLIAREIAYLACGDDPAVGSFLSKEALTNAFESVLHALNFGNDPVLLSDQDGNAKDFSYTKITQYGQTVHCERAESFGSLLDLYYEKQENALRIRHAASDILKTVNHAKSRAEKRMAARKTDLGKCAAREQLRIYGELLKANLFAIPNGSTYAEVLNYYDPEQKNVKIPLNPALTPANNAAKYFKDYKKSRTAEQTLTELIAEDERELVYLDSVLDSIGRCECLAELREIRDELCEAGYLRRSGPPARKQKESQNFLEYSSEEGYRILVGRNNKQNDYLTSRLAEKNDLWMHVKNIPGSHVIICCGGMECSEATLLYAAQLAAFHSKARFASQVPVDYTPVKYVKKPNGAKPGMVIYTTNQTIFVTPKEG